MFQKVAVVACVRSRLRRDRWDRGVKEGEHVQLPGGVTELDTSLTDMKMADLYMEFEVS